MYLVFNELSGDANVSKYDFNVNERENFTKFIFFLKKLKEKNLVEGLIISGNIYSYAISCNYTIQDWMKDPYVDNTYKQFLRSYIGRSTSIIEQSDLNGEFYIKIKDSLYLAIGCTFACEYENPVISLNTDIIWENKELFGEYTELNENAELVISEKYVENLNSKMLIEDIEKTHIEKLYTTITSGYDLWEQREQLFPNLIFCEDVKYQLYNDPERFHVLKIMEKLQHLQEYFAKIEGAYDPKKLGFNARTESESVKSDAELRKYRLFRMPSGEERFFYDHIGFSGKFSGGRIHFLPLAEEKKCYIGYIGRHLPTKKY